MPGISGMLLNQNNLQRVLTAQEALRRVHSLIGVNFHWKEYYDQNCLILNILTGLFPNWLDQPSVNKQGDAVLFVDGCIYDIEDFKINLDIHSVSLPAQLMALYEQYGNKIFSKLNGQFNIIVYDKKQKKLEIYNDRLATRPMYYSFNEGKFLFSSEKKGILAISEFGPNINKLGLLEIFSLGFNLRDRTFLEGIKFLPPGSHLVYQSGNYKINRYLKLNFNRENGKKDINSLIDEWGYYLKRAAQRRLKGIKNPVIFLSGGLDSRAVACSIPREHRPILSRTRGSESSMDAVCASKIARRLNFAHYIDEPKGSFLSNIIYPIIWRTECEISFSECLGMTDHQRIKKNTDYIITGKSGGASSGFYIRPFMLVPCNRNKFIKKVFRNKVKFGVSELSFIFNESFLKAYFPYVFEEFKESFDEIESRNNVDAFEIWQMTNMEVRYISPPSLSDVHLFEEITPFFDNEYLKFVLSLPTSLRFGQLLYQCMIYDIGPEIRDIPYANTGRLLRPTIRGNFIHKGAYYFDYLMTRRKNSIFNKLYQGKINITGGQYNLSQAVKSDLKLKRIVESFINSEYFDTSIFNPKKVKEVLELHYSGKKDFAYIICTLATFAAGWKYFIYQRAMECPDEAQPLSYWESSNNKRN